MIDYLKWIIPIMIMVPAMLLFNVIGIPIIANIFISETIGIAIYYYISKRIKKTNKETMELVDIIISPSVSERKV